MKKHKILIVEDEKIVANDLQEILIAMGYTVCGIATNNAKAIQLAEQYQPDLVLMDIHLKGERDGIQTAEQFQKRFNFPVIFVTAYSDERTLQRAKETEPYGYVIKPFKERELRSVIEMSLYKHKMDKKLRDSEEKIKSTILSMDDLVFILDMEGNFHEFYQSDTSSALYIPQEEFIGKSYKDIMPPHLVALTDSAIVKSRATGETQQFDYSLEIQGKERWFSAKLSQRKGLSNEFVGVTVVVRDITHRKLAEKKLAESEEKFKAIFDFANDAIIISDPKTLQFVDVNNLASKKLGYSKIELLKLKISDITPTLSQKVLKKNIEKLSLEENMIIQTSYKTKDGNEIPVELNSKLVEIGDKKFVQTIARDISELKHAEMELQKLYRAVIDNPTSIVITDMNGIIEYVNPKFTDVTGYSLDEAIGKNPRILKSGKQKTEIYIDMWNTILSGKTWRGEFHNKRKDGTLYWESASISPIINGDSKITNFVAVKEDISERKKSEEEIERLVEELIIERDLVEENAFNLQKLVSELSESEKMLKEINASKDNFFSIIAHDLKSPLSGVLGLSDLLANNSMNFEPDAISQMAQAMNNAAKQLFELLENLLEWSRSQTGRMEFNPTSKFLRDLVNKIISLFTETALNKGIEIISNIEKETMVYADTQMLNTCLRNLVSNALKFTNEGGKIIISAKNEKQNFIRISVTDTGIGIDKETLAKLFRIDVKLSTLGTAKERGTGLGLLLCKELVEKNGGTISVQSVFGTGSTFTFTLPKEKAKE